jgi:hypothetical protein
MKQRTKVWSDTEDGSCRCGIRFAPSDQTLFFARNMSTNQKPQKTQRRQEEPLTLTLNRQASRLTRAWAAEFGRNEADIASAAVIDFLGDTLDAIRKKDWNGWKRQSRGLNSRA